jgi:hypothetical protein
MVYHHWKHVSQKLMALFIVVFWDKPLFGNMIIWMLFYTCHMLRSPNTWHFFVGPTGCLWPWKPFLKSKHQQGAQLWEIGPSLVNMQIKYVSTNIHIIHTVYIYISMIITCNRITYIYIYVFLIIYIYIGDGDNDKRRSWHFSADSPKPPRYWFRWLHSARRPDVGSVRNRSGDDSDVGISLPGLVN